MRAFLALDIPDDTAAALVRLQSGIPFGRPVPEDNLHLTLAFFEDAPEDGLEALHEMLSALRMPPVEIRFTGLDSFTESQHGLIFADVARNQALQALHDRIASLCRQAGLDLPRRRFRPPCHLDACKPPPRWRGARSAGRKLGRARRFAGVHRAGGDALPLHPWAAWRDP